MRPPRGTDGSSPDRWHPNRPEAQRIWLGIYRAARWGDRFVGHRPALSESLTGQRRRMAAWAVYLASSRSRPTS